MSSTEGTTKDAPSTTEKVQQKIHDLTIHTKDAIKRPAHSSMNPDDETAKHEPHPNSEGSTPGSAAATAESTTPKQKKEKKPKPPKQPAVTASPLSPALLDLRVGHILRAIPHPDADSLYISIIDMGDAPGSEHTSLDEATQKTVRTVCSGLRGLVPLEEMQDRKIIVVANLKPVTMRGIKSAAMVLAASPKPAQGADSHGHDRVVELVNPPAGAEAGDKVYFEGWPYGEGKGPEKQLNPKKKQWEAIQPGFLTGEDLTVGFDASATENIKAEEGKATKGNLVVDGKGVCTVKTLKGAVVR
ncbi:putative cofactor for methionyland glutamyl-trna [Phaeomoniella chlamydospora]|uniref:Putative cofactor for methionyland glutamyl-trna n=1 Tax=Phaeomoniella chlamydospora TaxID=158046 RepID=A0A0G2H738_PHACM|nr:putative cofactor for methionyland glutamyl-trna [Phaeomoniella chlamydospora]